ncbi:MAG: response regulator transcription factor, partial [Alistipes sp.]|nr:response regulator transcription factor [Alistipes sp.]
IRCIAIDDEPLALRQVKNYIERVEKLELVALCSNAIEAKELLKTEQVDLLFVDINMPDINGIDFVRGLTDPPLVIYTTAYSEYALEGFRLDAVDYLLKPFSFDDFSRAAEKACSLRELHRMRDERAASVSTIESIDETAESNDYISIKSDYKVNLVRYNDIIYIESVGEYIRLHLKDGSKLTTLFRLKNMETELPQKNFMRVHRSYIVNIDYVSSFARGKIYLSNGDYVPISINYRDTFREHFEK